jgi:hypothetical protein
LVLVIIDGHHRLEAVGLLQACGYGPVGTKNSATWVIPTIVLKKECPDEICRAIAWALTDHQRFSHAMNTIDTLHAIRCSVEPRLQRKEEATAMIAGVLGELSMVSTDDQTLHKSTVEQAITFYKCVRTQNTTGETAYDEVLTLGCQHHSKVYSAVKALGGVVFATDAGDGLPPALLDSSSCFLPYFGSGNKRGGGFLPSGPKQSVILQSSKPDEVIALMRRAYAHWLVTGGTYLSKIEWEGLIGLGKDKTEKQKLTKWQALCKEDNLFLKEIQQATDLTEWQAMQVLCLSLSLRLSLSLSRSLSLSPTLSLSLSLPLLHSGTQCRFLLLADPATCCTPPC